MPTTLYDEDQSIYCNSDTVDLSYAGSDVRRHSHVMPHFAHTPNPLKLIPCTITPDSI